VSSVRFRSARSSSSARRATPARSSESVCHVHQLLRVDRLGFPRGQILLRRIHTNLTFDRCTQRSLPLARSAHHRPRCPSMLLRPHEMLRSSTAFHLTTGTAARLSHQARLVRGQGIIALAAGDKLYEKTLAPTALPSAGSTLTRAYP
jgi:hypothetical protein